VRGFERDGNDAAVAELDDEERMVIARIVADVGLLLSGEVFGMETPAADSDDDDLMRFLKRFEESLYEPDDPATLRLLPNAAPDDREVADEFRRLTEPDLRTLKVDRLRTVWQQLSEDGPEWRIDLGEALATAAALTDVRLVLASRLGLVTDDDSAQLHADIEAATQALDEGVDHDLGVDPERIWLGMLYHALTWLQESLVTVLNDEGEDAGDE